jgi:hypothetical protein
LGDSSDAIELAVELSLVLVLFAFPSGIEETYPRNSQEAVHATEVTKNSSWCSPCAYPSLIIRELFSYSSHFLSLPLKNETSQL